MRDLLTLLLLLALASKALAQTEKPGKISGLTADSLTGKPIAYVTVALKDGTRLLTGTTADGNGVFELPDLPLGNRQRRPPGLQR